MLKHGIEKCRVCENYLRGVDTCKFCHFEWATEYPPTDEYGWDILDIDDDVEWSFLQIMDRLKYKGIDCIQVINWFEENVIILIGCNAYADKIARALGVNEECMVQDLEIGITVVNLFKEKWLRGEIE